MEAGDLTYIVKARGDKEWLALPVEYEFLEYAGIADSPVDALRRSVEAVDRAIGQGKLGEDDVATDVVITVNRSSYAGVAPEMDRYFKVEG